MYSPEVEEKEEEEEEDEEADGGLPAGRSAGALTTPGPGTCAMEPLHPPTRLAKTSGRMSQRARPLTVLSCITLFIRMGCRS